MYDIVFVNTVNASFSFIVLKRWAKKRIQVHPNPTGYGWTSGDVPTNRLFLPNPVLTQYPTHHHATSSDKYINIVLTMACMIES